MKKNWIEKVIVRGGVFLVLPVMLLIGLGSGLNPSSGGNPDAVLFSNAYPPHLSVFEAEAVCSDSDGGQDSFVAGYVEGVGPNGYPYQKFDVCVDEDGVKEFYCKDTIPWPVLIGCDLGCLDGACLSTCTDGDGDGYSPQGGNCGLIDCDDTNPQVNPGEEENCENGIDDNCDGLIDGEDPACIICTDNDGDGYAVEGGLCGLVDCDDENYFVNPGAEEVCDNGIDDNCNDLADGDDPACLICTDNDGDGYAVEGGDCGSVDCDDNDYFVNPGVREVCDNGIDDNCNGLVDGDDSQCLGTNVIVIGWDGTQLDHFWECYHGTLEGCYGGLPEIASLSGGNIFASITTSGDTSTKPGWAQIFTGYRSEITGVYSNGQYQPIPLGYTVFEKVENELGDENVITAFFSGKDVNTGDACVGEQTTCMGVPCIESKGQPWCIASDQIDYFDSGLDMRFNESVTAAALDLLTTHQNELILAAFIYREPDVIGHVANENSVSYSASIAEVDYHTGLIIDKLIELGLYENTRVYIISDHGFDEGSNRHGNAPFTFVTVNDGSIIRNGDRYDLAATILADFGITLGPIGSAPALDGYPLSWEVPYSCVPEGSPYYAGGPACCADLSLISFDYPLSSGCMAATGGTGYNSGWCTSCGNGSCDAHENSCNCPADCP
jgi:hypothetical protein